MTFQYDARGNRTAMAYFDEQGQPTRHKDGYHKSATRYDERGNPIELAYFEESGQLKLHISDAKLAIKYVPGDHQIKWIAREYNASGNLTAETYLGADLRRRPHEDLGYAKATFIYDAYSNRIEETYLDIDNQPTLHKDGYAKLTAQYVHPGNRLELKHKYDTHDRIIEEAYFGADSRLVINEQRGFAKATAKYDEHVMYLRLHISTKTSNLWPGSMMAVPN